MGENMFTTTEVGKIMGVHFTTVGRWIDKGKLKGIITPSGHRRIREKDLIEYLEQVDAPLPEDLQKKQSVKILIIDDDEEVLNVLENGLNDEFPSFTICTAATGFEAGQIIGSENPDIVVLDIRLPDINGSDVCQLIKGRHKGTTIIAITGYGSEEVEHTIMDAGADVYMEKPFDVDELAGEIRKLCEKYAALQS